MVTIAGPATGMYLGIPCRLDDLTSEMPTDSCILRLDVMRLDANFEEVKQMF